MWYLLPGLRRVLKLPDMPVTDPGPQAAIAQRQLRCDRRSPPAERHSGGPAPGSLSGARGQSGPVPPVCARVRTWPGAGGPAAAKPQRPGLLGRRAASESESVVADGGLRRRFRVPDY